MARRGCPVTRGNGRRPSVISSITSRPCSHRYALAATVPLWAGDRDPWLRAARSGLADAEVARAARACLAAAVSALRRRAVPVSIVSAVEGFAERYVQRGRCPADDLLEEFA